MDLMTNDVSSFAFWQREVPLFLFRGCSQRAAATMHPSPPPARRPPPLMRLRLLRPW